MDPWNWGTDVSLNDPLTGPRRSQGESNIACSAAAPAARRVSQTAMVTRRDTSQVETTCRDRPTPPNCWHSRRDNVSHASISEIYR